MTDASIRQQSLHHLQQRVQQLDARDAELMLQLATARDARQSQRLTDELMDVRFRRVFQQGLLDDFKARHAL